jgi:hypothetical protein
MSQYKQGTVAFVNGSNSVQGTGTGWSAANVLVGQEIHHTDYPLVPYTVGAIDYINQMITLSSNYAGASDATASYVAVTDYTANHNLPEVSVSDVDIPAILTRALRAIDVLLGEGGGTETGTALPTASVDYRGTIFTVLGGPGVMDAAFLCVKLADDSYSWIELATA